MYSLLISALYISSILFQIKAQETCADIPAVPATWANCRDNAPNDGCGCICATHYEGTPKPDNFTTATCEGGCSPITCNPTTDPTEAPTKRPTRSPTKSPT
eukprot:389044_1